MRSLADVDGLVDALATLRSHWRRWGNDGFDAGEVKVARWLFVGQLALPGSSASAVAYRLFDAWNQALRRSWPQAN